MSTSQLQVQPSFHYGAGRSAADKEVFSPPYLWGSKLMNINYFFFFFTKYGQQVKRRFLKVYYTLDFQPLYFQWKKRAPVHLRDTVAVPLSKAPDLLLLSAPVYMAAPPLWNLSAHWLCICLCV